MACYPVRSDVTPTLCHAITLGALDRLFPRSRLETILAETHCLTERCRRLELGTILLLVIAVGLFARESQRDLLRRLFHAWRLRWPSRTVPEVPTAAAISIGGRNSAWRRCADCSRRCAFPWPRRRRPAPFCTAIA